MPRPRVPRDRYSFFIGEWYGYIYNRLTATQRRQYAEIQALPKRNRPPIPCPFQSRPGREVTCTKAGGICSMRLYAWRAETGITEVVAGEQGRLRVVCPNRFKEADLATAWVGQYLLGTPTPMIVNEVDFLRRVNAIGEEEDDDVGRIDKILFVENSVPLDWCALEIQAVYKSGEGMTAEFAQVREYQGEGLTFPIERQSLDYRSSGPKRLMPQLMIKVPSLRRWGRKMAVVVDRDFFASLAYMDTVGDVSNCDIAWFVLDLVEQEGSDVATLQAGNVYLTTLERSVEGLTAGQPVSRSEFERRILAKYQNQARQR